MRDYGVVSPKFWIGATGKALRGNADAQILALYLMTGPHATSTGVYHCPKLYMAHETGLSMEETCKALQSLIEAKFCEYDEASEWVFVCQMALFQIAEEVTPKDKRHKWLLREIENMPKPLKGKFISLYGVRFSIPTEPDPEPKPEAPSKLLRSQDLDLDLDQDLDQDQDHGQRARASVPRETNAPYFDGWEFVDKRMRPAYPRGVFRHSHWLNAARMVERLVAEGANPDLIAANAQAYCEQQEAAGNAGTKFVMAPTTFLSDGNWRGPFPLPEAPRRPQPESAMDEINRKLAERARDRAAIDGEVLTQGVLQ